MLHLEGDAVAGDDRNIHSRGHRALHRLAATQLQGLGESDTNARQPLLDDTARPRAGLSQDEGFPLQPPSALCASSVSTKTRWA